jgi:ABC-type transporter MlaC component
MENGANIMKHIVFAIIATCALGGFSHAAQAQSPNDVVENAAKALAAALEGRKEELSADKDALYALVDEILLPIFDRRYAAQLVLGRHWRDASEQEREAFIEAFYRSLLREWRGHPAVQSGQPGDPAVSRGHIEWPGRRQNQHKAR